MSQSKLYASLIGVLAVEAQRQSRPAGQVNAVANELWYTAAGKAAPAESKEIKPLMVLEVAAVERLCTLVAERTTPTAAALLSAESTHETRSSVTESDSLFRGLLNETSAKLSALPDKPEETAENTLRALWQVAAGNPMSAEQAAVSTLPALNEAAQARLRELLAHRFAGTPLAHLTGWQRFMGMELMASREALVPRKETELLGTLALTVLRQLARDQKTARVIDVCTGAGNLALTLATQVSSAQVYASDLSVEAVQLAKRNGAMLGLGSRMEFRQGDFLNPFADGQLDHNIDLLVCNPPYISTGKVSTMPTEIIGHEPSLAFDGGPFGVKILQRLLTEAPQYLRPGGWLAFEVGLGQGPALIDRLRRNPAYVDVAGVVDAAGAVRAVVARVQ